MVGHIDSRLNCNGSVYRDAATQTSVAWSGSFSGLPVEAGPALCRLYRQYGADFPAHIEGWYAVVVHDETSGAWCLARDPSGTIPLYYTQVGGNVYFADRIAPLLPHLPQISVHPPALLDYLTYLWMLEGKTFFEGVHLVIAGTVVTPTGSRAHFHFEHRDDSEPEGGWEGPILETLRTCVREAASAETACHLSGGIDSSLVVGFAREGSDISTYGTNFPDYASYDESVYAQVAADHFGVSFQPVPVRGTDFPAALPDLIATLEEPKCHPSVWGRYMLERATAADGFRRVLTGRGADELFTGYASHEPGSLVNHRERRTVFTQAEQRALLQPAFLASAAYSPVAAYDAVYEARPGSSPLERILAFDFRTLLANWMVVDYKMSAGSGIACRAPFLDRRMIDLALRIPLATKYPDDQPKALLRRAAARVLPRSLIEREKVGFRTPMGEMMRDTLETYTRDRLQPDTSAFWDWFRAEGVASVIDAHFKGARNYGWQLWGLLCVREWCAQFLDGGGSPR